MEKKPPKYTILCASERRVLTSVAIVDSGRAQASTYPRPHVWSRGPQLLLLLLLLVIFLTCFVTCSEGNVGGGDTYPSSLHHGFSSMSGHLRQEIHARANLQLLQWRKKMKIRFDFCEIAILGWNLGLAAPSMCMAYACVSENLIILHVYLSNCLLNHIRARIGTNISHSTTQNSTSWAERPHCVRSVVSLRLFALFNTVVLTVHLQWIVRMRKQTSWEGWHTWGAHRHTGKVTVGQPIECTDMSTYKYWQKMRNSQYWEKWNR